MAARRVRLGDLVDDYCSRCKLVMNHGIMALDGEVILKVQCNTCLNDHPYRRGKAPRRKDPVKSAFDELMAKLPGAGTPPARGRTPVPLKDEEEEEEEPEKEEP